jgi:hypothetical protein
MAQILEDADLAPKQRPGCVRLGFCDSGKNGDAIANPFTRTSGSESHSYLSRSKDNMNFDAATEVCAHCLVSQARANIRSFSLSP